MFAPRISFTLALAFGLLAAEISAQDNTKKPPPEPWQIAGMRAAFGEGPQFLVERSELGARPRASILCKEPLGRGPRTRHHH